MVSQRNQPFAQLSFFAAAAAPAKVVVLVMVSTTSETSALAEELAPTGTMTVRPLEVTTEVLSDVGHEYVSQFRSTLQHPPR